MSQHRNDTDINEIKAYFNTVIDWASAIFIDVEDEMKGLKWGEFYEKYHVNSYNPSIVSKKLKELYGDPYVKNRRGVCEFILGDCVDTKLLNIRVFDEATKNLTYKKQTDEAIQKSESNCPLCAIGHESKKDKIYKLKEMDADHVEAWSKGGATDISNCQMLCKTHNKAKGNS